MFGRNAVRPIVSECARGRRIDGVHFSTMTDWVNVAAMAQHRPFAAAAGRHRGVRRGEARLGRISSGAWRIAYNEVVASDRS